MDEHLTILAIHISRTLPDSLSERKTVLTSLLAILPDAHPAHTSVSAQLASIAALEQLQAELPFQFAATLKRR
jgi:hypothetical protein